MAFREVPANPLPLSTVAKALSTLGYKPENMLYDATIRMARVPALAQDMISYVETGQPLADHRAKTPAVLFRALPGDHTVASLIRDFGFAPVGAFLMGADLISDTEASLGILASFIQQGYWVTGPEGVRELRYPPIASRYPVCPECGLRLPTLVPECPRCGDNSLQPQEEMERMNTCPHCKKPHRAGLKFCPGCGATVPSLTLHQAPLKTVCPDCGRGITPGKKYCGHCGREIR